MSHETNTWFIKTRSVALSIDRWIWEVIWDCIDKRVRLRNHTFFSGGGIIVEHTCGFISYKNLTNYQTQRIAPILVNGIESFLIEREWGLSQTAEAISGVPQGSVIGPMLLVTHVNDLSGHFWLWLWFIIVKSRPQRAWRNHVYKAWSWVTYRNDNC